MAKPKKALTAAAIRRFKPAAPGRQADHFDALMSGLALRITSSGARSWSLHYRVRGSGKLRRWTFGRYGATSAPPEVFTLADARKVAREAKEIAQAGQDPRPILRARWGIAVAQVGDAGAVETVAGTFLQVTEGFITKYVERKQRPRTQLETRRPLDKYIIPAWGDRPIDSITRRDVITMIEAIEDAAGAHTAVRALAVLGRLFRWALDRDYIDASPCVRIERPINEVRRETVVADSDLAALWHTFDGLGYPFGPMFKILLVTGQRRSEIAGMRWSELDLEGKSLNLPGERTKNGRPHVVPLSPLALAILRELPRLTDRDGRESDLVFTTNGARPVSGFSRIKAKVEKRSGVTGWRLHDFRRTCATGMRRLKVTKDVVGAILNHAPQGITSTVYDQYDLLDEKGAALRKWARHLTSLTAPASDKVVPIHG